MLEFFDPMEFFAHATLLVLFKPRAAVVTKCVAYYS